MATTVGQHSVAAFTSPINGTTPIDANTVRSNDNTVRLAYVDHDADTGIHVQSSDLASRPVAGTAGRKWITDESGIYTLWFDDGVNWHPVSSEAVALTVLCTTALNRGDVVKVVGWNNGQDLPEVAKVASSSDIAFAVMTQNATINTMGYATNTGTLQDINTAAFAVGNILYPNTTGGFTATKPTSGVYQPVAFVLRSNATNGVIYVEFSAPRIVEASTNTASTVVLRDGSGNFSAGTITANLTGNVTGNITGTAPAGTLTGTTLASNVVSSSLTSVGTLSTLAVSGNLTVDTTTLTVDATNNRVGIGTATPGAVLDVASGISRFGGTGGVHAAIGNAFLAGQAELYTLTTTPFGIGTAGTQPLRLYTDAALRATLDTSGNLGLGVTPSAWNSTYKTIQIGASGLVTSRGVGSGIDNVEVGVNWYRDSGGAYRYASSNTVTDYEQLNGVHRWFNAPSGTAGNVVTFTQAMTLDTNGNLLVGPTATVNGAKLLVGGSCLSTGNSLTTFSGAQGGFDWVSRELRLFSGTPDATGSFVTFWTGVSGSINERLRIDSVGNVGIGATPSTASIRTLQVQNASLSSPGTQTYLTANAVFNTPNWKYIASDFVSQYVQSNGGHAWLNAASGTAGANVSFTQAMTLDASGNLIVGADPGGTERIRVTGGIRSAGDILLTPSAVASFGTTTNQSLRLITNNGIRVELDTSGNVGVGTTSPTARLDVNNDVNPTRGILQRIRNGASTGQTGAQLQFSQNAIADWAIGQPAAANSFSVWSNRTTSNDGVERLRVDTTATAGQTALLLWDVDNNTLERVTVGAADSGGTGFKVLRIPN